MHMHFTQIECHADARPGSTRTLDRCGTLAMPLAMPLTMKAPVRSPDPRWGAAS